jgi:carbonic anhydrase
MPMRDLLLGLIEFRESSLPNYLARFRELSAGQKPNTLFIACADSRIAPDLLTSARPGELFTMRNVGNLMPPAHEDGTSSGDLSEASAVEYAVSVLKVRNIIVCGHSNCGAMRAVYTDTRLDDAPNLTLWLEHARPARLRLPQKEISDLEPYDRLSQENVLLQLEHLQTYPAVRRALAARTLMLGGWWFDIASGKVHVHDKESGRFVLVDRDSVERLGME